MWVLLLGRGREGEAAQSTTPSDSCADPLIFIGTLGNVEFTMLHQVGNSYALQVRQLSDLLLVKVPVAFDVVTVSV